MQREAGFARLTLVCLGVACLPLKKGKVVGNLYCVSNLYKLLRGLNIYGI